MKIKRITLSKIKLLKLKLLKTQIYKKQINSDYISIKDVVIRLKIVLNVIYKFHAANKKILFIGTPLKLDEHIKQFLKITKHSYIAESVWINGILTNPKSLFKYIFKEQLNNQNFKISRSLFNLKKPVNLIVILNENTNIKVVNEFITKRLPIISLNCDLNVLNSLIYRIPGNFYFTKKEIRNNFFYLLLKATLKKAELFRKKKIKFDFKQKIKNKKKKWVKKYNNKKNAFFKKK